MVEFWVGATRPTAWARSVELALGAVLALLAMSIAGRALRGTRPADGALALSRRFTYAACAALVAAMAWDRVTWVGLDAAAAFLLPLMAFSAYVVTRRVWPIALAVVAGTTGTFLTIAAVNRANHPTRAYGNFNAARAAVAKEPWTRMPSWVPESARDIVVVTSINSEWRWLMFRATPGDMRNSFHEGRRVPPQHLGSQLFTPPPRAMNWPDVIAQAARGDTAAVYVRYRPPDYWPMCVFVDWSSGQVYAWTCRVRI